MKTQGEKVNEDEQEESDLHIGNKKALTKQMNIFAKNKMCHRIEINDTPQIRFNNKANGGNVPVASMVLSSMYNTAPCPLLVRAHTNRV